MSWIRPLHRWLSIAFTVAVLANFVAMGLGSQATWVGFAALVPLLPLLFTGWYLLAQPYLTKKA